MDRRTIPAAAALCAGVLFATAAAAQDGEGWEFTGAVYGYFPTLSGSSTLPGSGGSSSSSASVDIDTILDNLQFTFMGQFSARKGDWGVFTDIVYLDLGNSRAGSRDLTLGGSALPAGASAAVDYDLKGWLWTLAATYRAVSTANYALDVVAGARLLDIEQKLGWTLDGSIGPVPVLDRSGQRNAELSNWDAVVGIKGRAAFGEGRKWFVPYYLDLGAGGSKFTWQAIAGLGYEFGWGSLVAAWRYIDYEMKSGKTLEDLNFNGPGIAVVFGW